jgi:hypothetical protein
MSGETATVAKLPDCQVCSHPSRGAKRPHKAVYDAKSVQGPWAYMCEDAFREIGLGLGTGLGQRLVLIESVK